VQRAHGLDELAAADLFAEQELRKLGRQQGAQVLLGAHRARLRRAANLVSHHVI